MPSMTSTHAGPRPQPLPERPVRVWLLAVAALVGAFIGSEVGIDYGVAAGVVAAAMWCLALGSVGVFGRRRTAAWLLDHRVLSALGFAGLAFVTLAGLHLFTPVEDVVVATAAGIAATSLIAGS